MSSKIFAGNGLGDRALSGKGNRNAYNRDG